MPPFGGQSIRDKTAEFRAVADRLRKEQVSSPDTPPWLIWQQRSLVLKPDSTRAASRELLDLQGLFQTEVGLLMWQQVHMLGRSFPPALA